ncbi:MAG: hypothetical protein AAGD47_00525 [Pseudomonadota bacterium]
MTASVGTKPLHIEPASPWENPDNENFIGKLCDELRDELPNVELCDDRNEPKPGGDDDGRAACPAALMREKSAPHSSRKLSGTALPKHLKRAPRGKLTFALELLWMLSKRDKLQSKKGRKQ